MIALNQHMRRAICTYFAVMGATFEQLSMACFDTSEAFEPLTDHENADSVTL